MIGGKRRLACPVKDIIGRDLHERDVQRGAGPRHGGRCIAVDHSGCGFFRLGLIHGGPSGGVDHRGWLMLCDGGGTGTRNIACATAIAAMRRGLTDRRVTVSLTEAGRKMYERVLPAMARFNMELVATLTPEEQAQMDAILLKLRARALEMEQDGPYAALPRVDRGHKHG